jgi:hypothetical protein
MWGWVRGSDIEARNMCGREQTTLSRRGGGMSPFQPVKKNWKAVTFLNCNCISPESPGHRLIEAIEFSFRLERADG